MSYEQAMKHSKNHRKDRFYQQCSGYGGDGVSHQKTEKEIQDLAVASFQKLLDEAKTATFPIHIRASGGWYYSIVDERNLFGEKIDSYEDLIQFGKDYVGYEDRRSPSNKLSDKIASAAVQSGSRCGEIPQFDEREDR